MRHADSVSHIVLVKNLILAYFLLANIYQIWYNPCVWYNTQRRKNTMTERKQDRRIQRTKKSIRAAFVKLMGEKEIDRITIKELADEADVDRKTIYNYYSGVHEISEELAGELFDLFEKEVQDAYYQLSDPYEWFGVLTKLLSENLELYGQIINLDVNSYFFQKSLEYFKGKIREVLKRKTRLTETEREFTAEYITNGLFAAYRSWFNSDRSISLETFSAEVGELVLEGIGKHLTKAD